MRGDLPELLVHTRETLLLFLVPFTFLRQPSRSSMTSSDDRVPLVWRLRSGFLSVVSAKGFSVREPLHRLIERHLIVGLPAIVMFSVSRFQWGGRSSQLRSCILNLRASGRARPNVPLPAALTAGGVFMA